MLCSLPKSDANVKIYLVFIALAFMGRAMWSRSVLTAYIYLITDHDPSRVGYVAGLLGTSQVLFAFPSGYFADKYRRDTVIRFGVIFGLLGTICVFLSVLFESFATLCVAVSMWGAFWGVSYTAGEALFSG